MLYPSALFALAGFLVTPPQTCSAQELPSDDIPAFVEIVAAWDWAGMSEDEQDAVNAILFPSTVEEIERAMTPEELEQRRDWLLSR